jgi:SPP1 gp7 family putative phage head morphogenesis protein
MDMFSMKPQDAIKFLEEKGFVISWDWREQLKLNHAQAFTVAKAMKMDILQDIKDELDKSLAEGMTFREFQKELTPKLAAKGWWGKKVVNGKMVTLGTPSRLQIIYDTNMFSAWNAGRFKQQIENEDRPYLRYIAVEDGSTRPAHRALNGTIKRTDSKFWDRFYPPNGYRCRCRVRALTIEQAKERGITKGTPKVDGKPVKPDKGFSGNPAKDKFQIDKSKYDSDIIKAGNI